MKRILVMQGFLVLFLYSQANIPDLTAVRRLFLEAGSQPDKARYLYQSISLKEAAGNPLLIAYKGCARAMMADSYFWPVGKFKCFSEGKELIDESIVQDPYNPELRFLRLLVQLKTPSFLGYNNQEEDWNLLLKALASENNFNQDLFYYSMVKVLLKPDLLDKRRQQILEQTIPKKIKNE